MRIRAWEHPTGTHAAGTHAAGTHAKGMKRQTRFAVVATGVTGAILTAAGIAYAATSATGNAGSGSAAGGAGSGLEKAAVPRAVAAPRIVPGTAVTRAGKGANRGIPTGAPPANSRPPVNSVPLAGPVPRGIDGSSRGTVRLAAGGQFRTTVTTAAVSSPGTYYVTSSVSALNPDAADQVRCVASGGTFRFGGPVRAGEPATYSATDRVILAAHEPIRLMCESTSATAAHQTQLTAIVTAVRVTI